MRKISLAGALRGTSRGLVATARPDGLSAYAQSVVVVGLCTALAWQMSPYLRSGNLLMIYLMGTVVVATRFGRGPSIVAALSSVAAFDLLFVPPFNFALADVENLLTFAVLLAVALVISSRSARLREHAAAVREYERKTAAVREAARAVQVAQLQGLTAAALAIGSTLSVEEKEVWGPTYEDQAHYLRVFMLQLRRKLEADPARPRYLRTEPGVGYRLDAD